MTQIAVPTSDISTGVWTPTPVWSRVDEAVTGNGDNVDSDSSPVITETCEVGLSTISDPGVDTGHKIRFSAWKDAGGSNNDIDMMLVEGTTVVGTVTQQLLPESETEYLLEITSAAITDYTNLRIRWAAYKNGGGAGRAAHVGFVRLETPDASAQYSIIGAITTALTPAATMVYNLHRAIAGAVTTTFSVAAAMVRNINPALAGAVTMSLVPAATMQYTVGGTGNYVIDGAVTTSLSPAATMEHNVNPAVTGDVVTTLVPAAAMEATVNAAIVGDCGVSLVPSATMLYNLHREIAGAVTLTLVPSAVMEGPSAGGEWLYYAGWQGAGEGADLPPPGGAGPRTKQGTGAADHALPIPWQGHGPGALARPKSKAMTKQGRGAADVS